MAGEFRTIATLENEVEARLVDSVLEERGIPHLIRSYHAAMFDGVYQMEHGWGELDAPDEKASEILEILQDIRKPVPGEGEV